MASNRLELIISANDQQAQAAIKRVDRSLGGVGTTANALQGVMGKLGMGMAGLSVAALVSSLYKAGQAVDDLNDKLTASFGAEQAEHLLGVVQKLGATPPFTAAQFVDAAQKLQKFGQFSEKTLIGVGDLAAKTGVDIGQAAQLIGGALSGNAEAMKGLEIQMGITANSAEELRAKMEGAAGTMDSMANAGERAIGKLGLLKDAFGTELKAGADEAIGSIEGVLDALLAITDWAHENRDVLKIFSGPQGPITAAIKFVEKGPKPEDVLGPATKAGMVAAEARSEAEKAAAQEASAAWLAYQADVSDAIFEDKRTQLAALDAVLAHHGLTAQLRAEIERKRISLLREAGREAEAERKKADADAEKAAAEKTAAAEKAAADQKARHEAALAAALHVVELEVASGELTLAQEAKKKAAILERFRDHEDLADRLKGLELDIASTGTAARAKAAADAKQDDADRKAAVDKAHADKKATIDMELAEERSRRDLSTAEEIAYQQRIVDIYQKGTDERKAAEQGLYDLKARARQEDERKAKQVADRAASLQDKIRGEEIDASADRVRTLEQEGATGKDVREAIIGELRTQGDLRRQSLEAQRDADLAAAQSAEEKAAVMKLAEMEIQDAARDTAEAIRKAAGEAKKARDEASGSILTFDEFIESQKRFAVGGASGFGGMTDLRMSDPTSLDRQLAAAQAGTAAAAAAGPTAGATPGGSLEALVARGVAVLEALLAVAQRGSGSTTKTGPIARNGRGSYEDPVKTLSLAAEKATGTP